MSKGKTIRDEYKRCLDVGKDGILPLPIQYIFKMIAAILYYDATIQTGKKLDKEIIDVLQNGWNHASMMQGIHLNSFLEWWLDQDAEQAEFDDDGEQIKPSWWDAEAIVDSWNKFADIENERLKSMQK